MKKGQLLGLAAVAAVFVAALAGSRRMQTEDGTAESKRAWVVELARTELGKSDPAPYWLDVFDSYPGRRYAWCGVFALAMLVRAGVTAARWVVGIGFIGPLGLRKTLFPEPGDIAYFTKNQHHALVAGVADDGTVTLIQGNGQGGLVTQTTIHQSAVTTFYSIQKLL